MKEPEAIFEQKTDLRKIILHFLSYKWWIVGSIIVFLALAYIYNRFSKAVYENSTTIVVNKKHSPLLSMTDVISGWGASDNALDNEIAFIKSFENVSTAINIINASVPYFYENTLLQPSHKMSLFKVTNELYNNCPIVVRFDKYHVQPIDLGFEIKILSSHNFKLIANGKNVKLYDYNNNEPAGTIESIHINGTYTFGEIISNDGMKIKIEPRFSSIEPYINKTYYFAFNNLQYMALVYQRSLNVAPTGKNSMALKISLRGENPDKVTDFLNALNDVVIEKNLEKKNQVVNNTIQFIDEQISNISDSLVYTENRLQAFRSKFKVTNLSFQGEKIYEKLNELESQKAELLVKKQYYNYLKDYFERNVGFEDLAAPSSMGVDDPILNKLIQDLITANNQRNELLKSGSEKNLFLKDLEIKINNLISTIKENVKSSLNKLNLSIRNIDNRINALSAQISQLPRTERELFGIERKFKLNDAIYTFLLQKRAEAQISKSANVSDYEVIEPAHRITAYVVAPKKKLNYILAIFLGLVIPVIVIILSDLLREKIKSLDDIKDLPVQIYSYLYHFSKDANIIFERDTASPVAESVRNLCASIDLGSEKSKIITVSSLIEEEGKSFTALNMAACYSLMGFKTALVECDFRHPSLRRKFKIKDEKGVCGFLAGERSSLQPAKVQVSSLLDIYHAGKIKQNPLEFLSFKSMQKLVVELQAQYEKVIIDTSDINDQTDMFFILPYTDVLVFVFRHGKSRKKELKAGLSQVVQKGGKNICLVANEVPLKKNPYK